MNWSTALTVSTISAMLIKSVKEILDDGREKKALEKENEKLRKELQDIRSKNDS